MTVARDAVLESATFTTTSPHTFSFTPTGTPRAIIVAIAHGTPSTDVITGVTYGGVTMTRNPTNGLAQDSAGEAGAAHLYFLGASIPTGTQTVSITHSGSSTVKWAICASMTAAADTEIGASGKLEGDQADPQIALDTGATSSLRVAINYSGLNALGNLIALSGMEATDPATGHDFGNFVALFGEQTTASTGSFTIGYTANTDDVAMVAVAIQEIVTGTNFDETGRLVTVTSTVAVTDELTFGEALTVTVASTLTVTDRADYVQAVATTVTATVTATDSHDASEAVSVAVVATVTASDSIRNVEALAVTVASTVTGSDNLSFGESAAVTIVSTVTGTDIHSASEAVTVTGTVTVTATDQVDWNDAVTVTVSSTVTASDILTATDAAAFTIVSTVTGSDIMSGAPINYNETGRLVSVASTVTATDQVDVDENVTVTVASTVTASDLLGFFEPATVTIVSTVSGDDLATLTDNVTVDIVATITITDRITGPTFWQTDPAGYTVNPAAHTKNPAAYVPVGPSDSPPW